ncbi:hypothetical protein OHD16_19510 [Sphingobacterium sp. ML3W]|uniref:hypothetical protein n=1 Tax=Sphingobacterium sp. ML3W TaxID=1538644 RepID=UPI00249BD20C|nr:hypothetical protein [Sphingobacterium sp. ML3W]WFA82147.1 hypothetical protein OGI71_12650 [Sphingobacterium sp. ML3W]
MANQFLIKNTMAEMRALSADEITALQNGTYLGVKLFGYYQLGDTPDPIVYSYDTISSAADNGGSVIIVGSTRLIHHFSDGCVDVRYFGTKQDSGQTNNTPFIQKAANLKLPLIITNVNDGYYLIDGHVRIYNSVKGINNPILKVAESVNDNVELPLMRKGVLVLHNSQDDKFKTIEGITFDGSWNNTSNHSEQQHSIWISSSNNVIVRENVFKNCLGDGISMQYSKLTYEEVDQKYSQHVIIEDNIFDNQFRNAITANSAKKITIARNKITKYNAYVAPIDLEPVKDAKTPIYKLEDIIIENNIITAENCNYCINFYGSPFTEGRNLMVNNNILRSIESGLRCTASFVDLFDITFSNNSVHAKLMVDLRGPLKSHNVKIYHNKPLAGNKITAIVSGAYAENVEVFGNYSDTSGTNYENILIGGQDATDFKIYNNYLISDKSCVKLSKPIQNVDVYNNYMESSDSECIFFRSLNFQGDYKNIKIRNNYLNSVSKSVTIDSDFTAENVEISANMYVNNKTFSPGKFVVDINKSTDELETHNIIQKYSRAVPMDGSGFNLNLIQKVDSYKDDYVNRDVVADKYYAIHNGYLLGIGFNGEHIRKIGDQLMPNSSQKKVGERLTNPKGGIGNTLFIVEDATNKNWNPVKTILSGSSSQRPIVNVVGVEFFDVTLGKPIYWNGIDWVDASGQSTS